MSTEPPTFNHLIDLLTVDTPTFMRRDVGVELHEKQGLLQQLREAIFGGMEGNGGTSGYGSRPPLDPAAVDLLEEITKQASQALAAVSNLPTPYGHAEHYVRLWAGQAFENGPYVVTAKTTTETGIIFEERFQLTGYALARKWVDRVEAFFNPPVTAEVTAPCPRTECSARYVYRVKDGVEIQSAALNMTRDRMTGDTIDARCSACGTVWARDELERLAVLIGAKSDTPEESLLSASVE